MLDVLLVAIPALVVGLAVARVRSATAGVLCAVLTLGVVAIGLFRLSSVRAEVFGPTLLHGARDRPRVALTLDDGPTPAYTKAVLDLLEDAGAHATFFVTGAELTAHPELGRAIVAGGHELGNHSWSHPRLIFRPVRDEIERTDAAIQGVGQPGTPPFRPPYGKRLLQVHQVLGDRPAVLWDVEPESFPEIADDPEALTAHVLQRVEPGSIVLLHVMYRSREATRAALPQILAGLEARGLEVVSLRDLDVP